MSVRSTIVSLMAIGLAAALCGCRSAQVPVPATLDADRFEVAGRQGLRIKEELRFGEYRASNISRSWVRGNDLSFAMIERNRRKQFFEFDIHSGDDLIANSNCSTRIMRRTIRGNPVDIQERADSSLQCVLTSSADSVEWILELTSKNDQPMTGLLGDDRVEYSVRGIRALSGGLTSGETTGYRFLTGKNDVALVQIIGDGTVWLPTSDDRSRAMIAASSAALLLVEDLRAVLPIES